MRYESDHLLYGLSRSASKPNRRGIVASGTRGPSVKGCPRNKYGSTKVTSPRTRLWPPRSLLQAEPCHLVARRFNLRERLPQPVGIILLPLRPSQVDLLLRVVVQVVEVVAAKRPQRPVGQQVAVSIRLSNDRHSRARHPVEVGSLVRWGQPQLRQEWYRHRGPAVGPE